MTKDYLKYAERLTYKIQAMQNHPVKNMLKIRRLKKMQIQALGEGARDVLTTHATDTTTAGQVVDKNNYREYSGMVEGAYNMYFSECDYGGEIFAPLVDTRVAIIGGEGINVTADKKPTRDYIEQFLRMNKLHGSGLIRMMRIGELEGKDLLVLKPKKISENDKLVNGQDDYTDVDNFSWHTYKYTVEFENADGNEVTKIYYKKNNSEETINLPLDKSVYVQLGGVTGTNKAVHRLHKCLTQCENLSRAGYDLRKNSHLFGKISPNWYLDPKQMGWEAEAKAINNHISSDNYNIGDGYAGPAKFGFVGPPADGVDLIIKDMLTSLKFIASMTGIPIHWLSWPELMSNRATAENMAKMIEIATRAERLIWEESLEELIFKSMIMAVDDLGYPNDIIGDFSVDLPTLEVDHILEILAKFSQFVGEFISRETFMNMIPGIDPIKEMKRLEKENEERMSQLTNEVNRDTLEQIQEEEGNEDENNRD